MFQINSIGYFHTDCKELYQVPRQPSLANNHGHILLKKGYQFEQALQGIEGFDLIWVLFCFHRHTKWKPMVMPPRGGKKQGVFATRSPHRPNFIGMSCVKLEKVEGLKLWINNHDLIDGTPIVDIKPYLNEVDCQQSQRQGWLENLRTSFDYTIEWSELALTQITFLLQRWTLDLQGSINDRLKQSPLPYASNRVKLLSDNYYQLAYQTWRIRYRVNKEKIIIEQLFSGYDTLTLQGLKKSSWDDVAIHQDFVKTFNAEHAV